MSSSFLALSVWIFKRRWVNHGDRSANECESQSWWKSGGGNWSSITRPPTTKSPFASSPAPCIINWYQACLITLPPRRRRRNWQFAVNPDSLSRQHNVSSSSPSPFPPKDASFAVIPPPPPPGYFLLNGRICQTCVAFLVIVLKVYRPDGRSLRLAAGTRKTHIRRKDLSLKKINRGKNPLRLIADVSTIL